MGLDITAYSHLVPVGKHVDDWCENEDHVETYAYDSFPQSFLGIPILSTSTGHDTTLLEGGCYAISDLTETHGFRAGSYSGYNRWRADLQAQFNPERDPDGPFYELIWFADNEGCIGPDAARDLLADFLAHASRYKSEPDQWGDMAAEKYRDWTTACDLAANCGVISFH
jgi:hypothetical protein